MLTLICNFPSKTVALKKESCDQEGQECVFEDSPVGSTQDVNERKNSGGGDSSSLDKFAAFGFNKMMSIFYKSDKNSRKKSHSSIPAVLKEVNTWSRKKLTTTTLELPS